MNGFKIFVLTFVLTWVSAICLLDYYRDDICNLSDNMDYEMNANLGESDSMGDLSPTSS